MEQKKLDEILEKHEKWLNDEGEEKADLRGANLHSADLRGANLRNADLGNADLRGANLHSADLGNADLGYADLRYADLGNADLGNADLGNADLRNADLRDADLSQAQGLLSQSEWMAENLEKTDKGYIAYKSFGQNYNPPTDWKIAEGEILEENVSPCRTIDCGCGVNVATENWTGFCDGAEKWKVLIRWEWLPGVVVPYNTDGKFRVEKCELLEIVQA